ncbi:uncharacterized protein G2W53_004442 [Senna tora]|uniref:Uncharacterized protein n=1 Tax=Senna tora TaxID=362788 RepID=A0A835CH97_9FABA|nr:uncharacterized protein G2W53_004442 [Senna tora]
MTCAEGVDDATKVLATCMEEFNDVTTNGSRDKCERVDDVTHPSWYSACEDSKDEVEWQEADDGANKGSTSKHGRSWCYKRFQGAIHSLCSVSDNNQDVEEFDDACEQRQQGRARGCVQGFDDGATEDSDNHTKKDGILCALKDALTECGKCLTFIRWGGDDQPWMLGMSKGMLSSQVNFYIESYCVGFLHFASLRFKVFPVNDSENSRSSLSLPWTLNPLPVDIALCPSLGC